MEYSGPETFYLQMNLVRVDLLHFTDPDVFRKPQARTNHRLRFRPQEDSHKCQNEIVKILR